MKNELLFRKRRTMLWIDFVINFFSSGRLRLKILNEMELYIYSGFGELPSIDFDCLRTAVSAYRFGPSFQFILICICRVTYTKTDAIYLLQTFIKFNNVPAKMLTNGNPFKSPNGFLPYLRCDDGSLTAGYDEIISHLKSKVCWIRQLIIQMTHIVNFREQIKKN